MGAKSVSCCSNYGPVPPVFSYSNVICKGTEQALEMCGHLNGHDCESGKGAGVVCITQGTKNNGQIHKTSYRIYSRISQLTYELTPALGR